MTLTAALKETFNGLGVIACDDLLKMASHKISQGYSLRDSVELAAQEYDEMWDAMEARYFDETAYYAQFDY